MIALAHRGAENTGDFWCSRPQDIAAGPIARARVPAPRPLRLPRQLATGELTLPVAPLPPRPLWRSGQGGTAGRRMADGLAGKLAVALKVCSLSRGRLAAELAVDKSVVSRWLSGANAPSEHNLSVLTRLIAEHAPGFTMLDWDLPDGCFADRLRGPRAAPSASDRAAALSELAGWLPDSLLDEVRATVASRGHAYEGLWRSTRLANDLPGRFVHDSLLIRRSPGGLLRLRLGVIDMRFEGWTLPIQTQLFTFAVDPASGVVLFGVFNAVMRNRAEVLDGLTLTLAGRGGGAPVAAASLMERTGDLTGDEAADDARFEAAVLANPLAPEGSVPPHIRDHLFHDIGPGAFARGGPALLMLPFAQSLSRGPLSQRDLDRERAARIPAGRLTLVADRDDGRAAGDRT